MAVTVFTSCISTPVTSKYNPSPSPSPNPNHHNHMHGRSVALTHITIYTWGGGMGHACIHHVALTHITIARALTLTLILTTITLTIGEGDCRPPHDDAGVHDHGVRLDSCSDPTQSLIEYEDTKV